MVDPQQFADAVWQGDAAAVDAMIAAGADVNTVPPEGYFTPLHLAVEQMNVEIARRLIEAGADVNHDLGDGWTPLAHAIDVESDSAWQAHYEPGHETTEVSELLLAAGAKITERAVQTAQIYDKHRELLLRFARRDLTGGSAAG